MTESTRVISLWAVPRSVSTAFEKTFACRADTRVSHEPFTDCYYFSRDRRSQRYGDHPERADHTSDKATATFLNQASPLVFVKDLAFQAEPYLSDELLSKVTSTFILRHPRSVLRSLTPLKPNFTEDEFGYTALQRLFQRVVKQLERPPVVVDGDAFRHEPEGVLREYCETIGVPFDVDMLHWDDGRIRDWSRGEEESQAKWHRTLESSHTILPPSSLDEDVPVPPERREQFARAVQIYEDILSAATSVCDAARFTAARDERSVTT